MWRELLRSPKTLKNKTADGFDLSSWANGGGEIARANSLPQLYNERMSIARCIGI